MRQPALALLALSIGVTLAAAPAFAFTQSPDACRSYAKNVIATNYKARQAGCRLPPSEMTTYDENKIYGLCMARTNYGLDPNAGDYKAAITKSCNR